MSGKLLAFIGIFAYVFAVSSSATDMDGNQIAPSWMTAISGALVPIFLILATIKLWRYTKVPIYIIWLSILVAVMFMVINHSSSTLIVNIMLATNLLAYIWIICALFVIPKQKANVCNSEADHSD